MTPPLPTPQSGSLIVVPLWIIAVLLTMAAMHFTHHILVPLAIALLLACILQPLVRWMRSRLRMGPGQAALVSLILLLGVQVLAGIWTWVGVQKFVDEGPKLLDQFKALLTDNPSMQRLLPNVDDLSSSINSLLGKHSGSAVATLTNVLAQWILVMFMTFFFLAEGDWLLDKASLLFGHTSDGKRRVSETFERIGAQFVRFMVVRTLINVGVGVVVALSLFLMGIPYWQTWGILAAVLTYIPYLGPIASAMPPMVLALLEPQLGPGAMVVILVMYCVVFVLEGYVAVPMLMGKSLDLNATTVMISCLFWWFLWGEVGLVLAIPFTAAIKLTMSEIHSLRYWSDLMSAEPGH